MAKGGRYLSGVAGNKGKGKRFFVILLILLVLLTVVPIGAALIYYNSTLNLLTRPVETEYSLSDEELVEILGYVPEKIDPAETETLPEETTVETTVAVPAEDPIINVMLIGHHMQDGQDSKLSDTLILCSINKDTKTVTLTSFLRDTYLKLPDYKGHRCGKNRINVAYNLGWRWAGEKGGMEMLDQLILENFGVEVDYNVEVGFESFTNVINAVGGVEIAVDDTEAWKLGLGSAGTYVLDGEKALAYARLRSIDNDINRSNRQRKVITALIKKAMTMNLGQLNDMLKQVLPMVITDMSNEDITSILLDILPMLKELKIESQHCPKEGTYFFETIDISGVPSNVIKPDLAPNREMLIAVAEPPVAETEPGE